jgi:Stage II sporulation protein E (SpoIIE)
MEEAFSTKWFAPLRDGNKLDVKVRPKTHSSFWLSLLVLAGITSIAYADHLVASGSLAFLYFLPLALSGLIHRLRTSLLLVLVCVGLSDWFGSPEHIRWRHSVRNLMALIGFTSVVLFVNRLSVRRTALSAEVQAQAEELAKDMKLAAEVQPRLLPQHPPSFPGFDIAAQAHPARVVDGDLYDFIEMQNGSLGLVIADVAGKSVAAGLFMPAVKIALRANLNHAGNLEMVMTNADQIIYELTDEERFASLFYGILDTTTRRLCYINAGHQPPLLWRSSTGEVVWLEKGGPVMGLLPDVHFETGSVELLPRDLLVLYTDGLVETHNAAGEEFSRDRLLAVAASHSGAASTATC